MIVAGMAVLALAVYLGPLARPLSAAAADSVTVSLTPASIVADGASTTTATATVTFLGAPVDGETVTFASTDPNEQISSVTALGGGSGQYQAAITSSTAAGTATITATDTTALPAQVISPGVTLTQTPGPAASLSVSVVPGSIAADGTAAATATATVVDAHSNPVQGDSIRFSSTLSTVSLAAATGKTNASGQYSTTVTGTKVGTATIKATDNTAGGLSSTAPRPLNLVPGPAASIAASVSPSSIVADGTSSTIATATVTDANGNAISTDSVAFSSSDPGEVVSGTTPHSNGTYTATIRSSTTVGAPTITATDSSVKPPKGLSGHATVSQTAAGSTVVLSVSPTKALTNQSVTLIATVQTTGGAPSGIVAFRSGAAAISGCTNLPLTGSGSIGTVTCVTSFAAGSPPGPLTAVFTPSTTTSLASTSAAVSLVLTAAPTATTLSTPSTTTKVGAKVSYSASVTASETGAVAPGGSVTLFDGTKQIKKCSALPLAAGVAACLLRYRKQGSHVITAHYSGDSNFTPSASPGVTTRVAAAKKKLPYVTSTMTWSFLRATTYSKVISLVVRHPPASGNVVIDCSGRGCPFANHTMAVPSHRKCRKAKAKAKGKCTAQAVPVFDLTSQLRNDRLAIGAKLVIEITKKHHNAKYYSFQITSAGPQSFIGCIAPGHTKPNHGCTLP
jgi:adhesin/invasin